MKSSFSGDLAICVTQYFSNFYLIASVVCGIICITQVPEHEVDFSLILHSLRKSESKEAFWVSSTGELTTAHTVSIGDGTFYLFPPYLATQSVLPCTG